MATLEGGVLKTPEPQPKPKSDKKGKPGPKPKPPKTPSAPAGSKSTRSSTAAAAASGSKSKTSTKGERRINPGSPLGAYDPRRFDFSPSPFIDEDGTMQVFNSLTYRFYLG